MLKFNRENAKITSMAPLWRLFFNLEYISDLVLVLLMLNLNKFLVFLLLTLRMWTPVRLKVSWDYVKHPNNRIKDLSDNPSCQGRSLDFSVGSIKFLKMSADKKRFWVLHWLELSNLSLFQWFGTFKILKPFFICITPLAFRLGESLKIT